MGERGIIAVVAIRLERLRNADLNLLVYFAVLVEEKSVTRAAKRLRLTQSALSRVLQRLRELFQDDLLVRINGSYDPTPRGQEILQQLAFLLPKVDELLSGAAFNPAEDEVTFRVTAADSLSYLYGPLLATRHEETANVTYELYPYGEQRYSELEANSRDLVLDADFKALPANLYREVLFEDSLVCAVAKNSSYKTAMSLSQYLSCEHVAVSILDRRQPLLDLPLMEQGFDRRCPFSVPYFGLALRMAGESNMVATLPRVMSELLADRRRVRLLRPPKEMKKFRYVMVWHKRQDSDPRNRWLRQQMRELTGELLLKLGRARGRRTQALHERA